MAVRRGTQLTSSEHAPGTIRARVWSVDVEDYGLALTKIKTLDIDGSGEAPGVTMEFEHVGCPEGAAIAFSAREAELISRAFAQAAAAIKPSMRLRAHRARWRRELVTDQSQQPTQELKPVELIALGGDDQADALLAVLKGLPNSDPRKDLLRDVIKQLEIPF